MIGRPDSTFGYLAIYLTTHLIIRGLVLLPEVYTT